MKEFIYLGLKFEPFKQLKGKSAKFENVSKRLNSNGVTPKGWNYNNFYKEAKKAGAGKIDLFIDENGTTRIPAENYLFIYN